MAKITEYPVVTEIQDDDVLLVDGENGTRGLSVSGFSEAVADKIVESTAITGLVADIKEEIQDAGDAVIASIPQDYTELTAEVDDLKSNLGDSNGRITDVNKEIGYNKISLNIDNLINQTIGATGEPAGSITNTRVCTKRTIPIVPNMPVYLSRTISGWFNPLFYLFKGGVFQSSDNAFVNGKTYDADAIRLLFFKNPNTDTVTPQEVVENFTLHQESSDSYKKQMNAIVDEFNDINNDILSAEYAIGDNKESISDIENDTGIHHLILSTHNLVNKDVRSSDGGINVDNTTRVCNADLIPVWSGVPIYMTQPTGWFSPLVYTFVNGVYTGYSQFYNGTAYTADAVRFLFFKNPTTTEITPNDVASAFTFYQEKADSYSKQISDLSDKIEEIEDGGNNDYSLIAYGDSLTTGAGATSTNDTYWAVCASELNAKSRIGFGYGGSSSKPIAFTAGALSAYIPPNLSTFALKYADLSSDVSIASNRLNGKTVIIGDAEYTISQSGNTEYSLGNSYTPSNIYKPVMVKDSRYTADIYIIWIGTNDNGMQWDIVDAMIAKLPHKKYVVMGLTRLGTDTSIQDELKGYEKYGSHYFNTRVQIINNAFAILGTAPTAEDTAAIANGLIPPSLLVDSVHFNANGYEVIGKLLATHIKSLGYVYQKAQS